MASETAGSTAEKTASVKGLTLSGAGALVLSLAVNWVIVFGANTGGIAPELDALTYGPVTLFTALGVVGATVTYGVLTRIATNPDRLFVIVAAIVLLLSLIPDFTVIPDQPGGSLVAGTILGVMHVTTAVICVGVLTR
ncbi:DUF6069 family protein [Natronorubrum thiooxidans]|uniref:Uncharacterized protein n=1 Tax=Natronorubrum thiooxidans TaxID=308853 RepID=A0A1N7EUD7_9EURY|nr:DUF6069 family protein [Natronorubrum thiooxidans]SIR91667.1 hypothetical protein SAMN05421752_10562 [Natronorubrum thiooxidans]